jgi:hypothetical protein
VTPFRNRLSLILVILCLGWTPNVSAQVIESVGTRAMGMGGAFVAVATDSTASWWNPAAQAAGPFFDLSLDTAVTERRATPGDRARTTWFTLATPPVGFSYYHFRITNIAAPSPTGADLSSREGLEATASLQSLTVSQLGVTLVQAVAPGVHVGTTLKYLRGTLREGLGSSTTPEALLDEGAALDGGQSQGRFDLDIGAIAVAGPLRVGATARNLTEPEFDGARLLRRQYRLGVAYDAEPVFDVPLVVALDADVRSYQTGRGDRRVVAMGAERWFAGQRVGVRGGLRFNTVGAKERAVTAGASYAVRSGLFVEGDLVGGGADDERGWGVGARVSF